MKKNSKERDYIGWSGVLLFLNSDLVSVCTCTLAQIPKARLGDTCFNCKQVSNVYCIIINSDSL